MASKIPKTIHQIWIGPAEIPDWCEDQANEMREVHEKLGWEYKFWGNEVLDLYKDDKFLTNYLKNPKLYKWSYITDRLRVLILRDYGGVYVDIDCKIIKPLDYCLDNLSDNIKFFCGARQTRSNRSCLFEVAVIGSVKNGRITNAILNSYKNINWANGGGMHSDVILENIDVDVAVFNYKKFYNRELTDETVILHDKDNLGSWYKSDEELEKLGYKLN